ncbi:MAG TPA: hypothetical protein VH477_19290 [Bryobacteraceae bacterium]|jgi:hypothetical protein
MLSLIRNLLATLLVLTAVVYAGDYAILRYRIATNRNPFSSVTVRTVLAVPQKNRSTEFLPGDTQQQTCVHSLFPHMNDAPCWYLNRHKEQQINM